MNEAPLNYLQRYILRRLQEKKGASTMFNLAKLFRLKKGIDLKRLADSLAEAGRAHQALLSVIHRGDDGEFLQMQYLDDDEIEVEVVKVHEANFLARRASYVKVFDTFDEGLVDAIIFDCGENAYLLSNIHHLVCDGYSFPIILQDAKRAWDGEELGEDAYYSTLVRREARAQLPVAAAARTLIRDVQSSRDFVVLPRPDMSRRSKFGSMEFALDIPANFDAFLEDLHATRTHFFLAATALALSKVSGSNDVDIDWVFHGRLTKEELKTVGAFMVDLPFPLVDIKGKSPEEVIFDAKHWMFFGIKNAHAIVGDEEELDGSRRLTFVYQDEWGELMSPGPVRPDGPFSWMIEETLELKPPAADPENPFNVEIIEHTGGRTCLYIEYDAGSYSSDVVKRYREAFGESCRWLMS